MNLLNILNLYNDIDFFENIMLPPTLDKELVVNSIIDYCAVNTPLYTDKYLFKAKVETFFRRNYKNWLALTEAWDSEYNPIHNYDRHEDINRKVTTNNINNIDMESITNNNENVNAESIQQISAFDSNIWSNSNKENDTNSIVNNTNVKGNTIDNLEGNTTEKSSNYMYGNIGVTTTQQMLESEIDLRERFNVYDIIARKFYKEMMLKNC